MYKRTPDLIAILEIICSQAVLDEDWSPELFSIRRHDLEESNISFHTMKSCLNTLQAKDYLHDVSIARLDLPYEETDFNGAKFKLQHIPDRTFKGTDSETGEEKEVVIEKGGLFHENELANGYIMGNVWLLLSKLKNKESIDDVESEYLSFDESESLLKIGQHLFKLAPQKKRSHAHYMLTYIFETDKTEEYSFEHLANMNIIGDDPEQYLNACKDGNKRIAKMTKDIITDFFDFDSESVQINKKYHGE